MNSRGTAFKARLFPDSFQQCVKLRWVLLPLAMEGQGAQEAWVMDLGAGSVM